MSKLVIALVCVMCVTATGCSDRQAKVEDAATVAEAFLSMIRSGDTDSAWEGTTSEFKSFMGRDRLRHFVMSERVLKEPATLISCQPSVAEGLTFQDCTYTPKSPNKVIRVLLISDQGQWKIERLYVESR